MKKIGQIIADYRKKAGLKQADFCEKLSDYGISIKKSAISAWEQDIATPNAYQLFAICKIFGITDIYQTFIGELPPDKNTDPFAGLNEEGINKAKEYISLLLASGMYNKPADNIVEIAPRELRLYNLPVSAGTGEFLDRDDYELVSVGIEVPEGVDFGVRISGDSMMPRFIDGQIAWIKKTDEIMSGQIGIFYLNGNAYIKKLQDDENGVALISLNPAYAPIRVGENDSFKTFGLVMG